MDTAWISAFSAVMGSLVGAFTSFVTTYANQRAQYRRDFLSKQFAQRENLYSEFISVISALGGWIRREEPKLTLAPIGRYGTPAVRQPDAIVPFKAALYRNSLPGAPGHLLVTHRVDELDDSRTARIERACRQKFPKLAVAFHTTRASPNMNSTKERARNVFPTPVGSRKMNDPIGRRRSAAPGQNHLPRPKIQS
jgi:hypothetical protein